jgi:hypothetical protein
VTTRVERAAADEEHVGDASRDPKLSLTIRTVEARAPVAVGANRTPTRQVSPAAKVSPVQVSVVRMKSSESPPLLMARVTRRSPSPSLVIVTD